MKDEEIHAVVRLLKREVKRWKVPIVTEVARQSRDPFRVLISTVLSTRTKDDTTALASERLFKLAGTPQEMLRLSVEEVADAIYPVGFYKTKARNILAICRDLIDKHHSSVPDNLEDLLALNGVGRKVANLVITLGYRKKGICVDTHVHRVCNRLGYVQTRTPEQTEMTLRRKLPRSYWIVFNDLLVTFGQNVCGPLSPRCSSCPVARFCARVGVGRSR